MSDTIYFSPRGAFSYMWNKGVNSDNPCLIRFGKSMACLFKALLCGYSVEKVEVRACLDGGHHRNSIFFKECHKKLETFKVELVNESSGETHNDHKEELPRESKQNISLDELENLVKDGSYEVCASCFSTESLEWLSREDRLRLFCKACELDRDAITLRLLTVVNGDLSMPFSENEKKNVLSFFLRYGMENKVRLMLEIHNIDVNSPDNKGNMPIMTVAKLGHTKCLELLINKGANVCGGNTLDGCSPLFYAALNGHADTLKRLLDAGAKIDEPNEKGVTPLHAAAFRNHEVCLNLLLIASADFNKRNDHDGDTPISRSHEGQ